MSKARKPHKPKPATRKRRELHRYLDDYASAAEPKRKNSARKLTKAERQVKAQKSAAKRRVAVALAKFLKQANPSRRVPANVRVTKLKGGGFTIRPVKAAK